MEQQTKTKKALIMSVLSVFLCIAMLIGMTFAWFTDTASTGVNKIQAGNLDVALERYDTVQSKWVSAEGETLDFVKATGHESEAILWEPGCTYELPKLRVVNNGNLALKYKVQITGIEGSDKLNEVIDWTIGDVALGTEQHLAAGANNEFTIKGHMQKTAGNEYQGLSIDGIAITVVATQDTAEFDSFNNEYDKDATYPKTLADIKATYSADGINMPASVEISDKGNGTTIGEGGTFTITLKDKEAFLYFTQVFDRQKAFEAREAALNSGGVSKYPSEYDHADLNMWYGPYCSRITVKMGCDVDLDGAYIKPFGLGGYDFYFDGNGHTIKNAKIAASSGQVGFFASKAHVKNVVFDNIVVSATGCDSAGVVAGSPNTLITDVTVKNSSVTGAKYTGAIAGYNYGSITNCTVDKTIVSGQYKVGGILGYICEDERYQVYVTGNKLTDVTVKGENIWSGKTGFVIGKIVGNWNAIKGTCKDNTFSGTTTATNDIGEVESRSEAGLNK